MLNYFKLGRLALLAVPLLLIGADQTELLPGEPYVVVCPIEGMIDDGTLVLVQRAIREAEGEGVQALIFQVDTPGGRVDSAVAVTQAIIEADVRTIAYITGMGATSAGALISYACEDMVMEPGSTIGASAVVTMGAEGTNPAGEKATSFVRAKYRSLAEKNGHNPDIAEAMVDEDIELRAWRGEDGELVIRAGSKGPPEDIDESDGGSEDTAEAEEESVDPEQEVIERVIDAVDKQVPLPDRVKDAARKEVERDDRVASPEEIGEDEDPEGKVVLPKGKLLTLSAGEALDWGVAAAIVESIGEVVAHFDIPDDVKIVRITPTWSEELFKWMISPTISGLLLMLGIGGLYVEIRTPGFGLPGIIGVTCLALFFGSRAIVGLADWIDLVLLTVGLVLILVEVLVLPGFGIPGAAGILCLLAGIYLAFTRVPIPQFSWDYQRLQDMTYTLTITLVGFGIFSVLVTRYLPKTPFYNRLVLASEQTEDEGYIVQTQEHESAVGQEGVATSNLRPSGRGRFEGKTVDIVSDNVFIDKGTPVRIVRVDGNRYVVAPIEEATSNEQEETA